MPIDAARILRVRTIIDASLAPHVMLPFRCHADTKERLIPELLLDEPAGANPGNGRSERSPTRAVAAHALVATVVAGPARVLHMCSSGPITWQASRCSRCSSSGMGPRSSRWPRRHRSFAFGQEVEREERAFVL